MRLLMLAVESEDMFNSTLQTTINDLLYDPLYKGDAWNTTRGTYINKLQTAVDSANKMFK